MKPPKKNDRRQHRKQPKRDPEKEISRLKEALISARDDVQTEREALKKLKADSCTTIAEYSQRFKKLLAFLQAKSPNLAKQWLENHLIPDGSRNLA